MTRRFDLFEIDDDITGAVRVLILENAEQFFALMSSTREGRVELMKHRKIALHQLKYARNELQQKWAMVMLWHIDRAVPPRSRPRRRRGKKAEAIH